MWSIDDINTVCVCGSGTMGAGIAQVAARSGFHTILYDVNAAALEKASIRLTDDLAQQVNRGKLSDSDKTDTLSRLRFVTDMNDCLADVFIEAIVEDPLVKAGLFNQLNEFNHSEVIFATNTSSLSVTAIAKNVMHPERVVGMHFFNPAPLMKLVEVVNADTTEPGVSQLIAALARKMGKTPVFCKDSPGFIVNHVARPYYIEALRLAEEGVADFATIDALMESSGFKMGPFKLMDLIGNDINYAVSCSVFDALGQPERLRPSAIQKERVDKNELGRKTGKGYYDYSK
ncbi:MAG: 3-hydroxybutyryl-CoA dehydrogenase [Gemmatimonadaceae bacterium]|nr:3-hydroxybutyryl-CoA dehydrogenase [Chitinophagaceae bacterium]